MLKGGSGSDGNQRAKQKLNRKKEKQMAKATKEIRYKLEMCETDNDFNPKLFDIMCEKMEAGKGIWLYCWCTGHTRCAMVISDYTCKLRNKYGDKLKSVRDVNGWNDGFILQ